jgi:hypothetical protein
MPPDPNPTLSADQCRALTLLVGSPSGLTESLLTAHGFPLGLIAELISGGLVVMRPELMNAGGRVVEVTRLHIAETGRQALLL